MSVINQMLKDLDKRQSDQHVTASHGLPQQASYPTGKLILIIIAVVLILNVVGIFGWQLYNENQQLRLQSQQAPAPQKVTVNTADAVKNKITPATDAQKQAPVSTTTAINQAIVKSETLLSPAQSSVPMTRDPEASANSNALEKSSENTRASTGLADRKVTAAIAVPVEVEKNVTQAEQIHTVEQAKPSLTISRRQLSPQALAANKITQAEQAMERNDIAKAESLFEEVLLVMPSHETARKQLAALWYGKRHYQDAVNLLSQGIALAPKAEEMRLMSARIYYEQGQARQALNILSPVKQSSNSELQALLANAAAELNEHESAIEAFEKLMSLEPNVGRWWLGAAVSLDSLGKFVPARDAYTQAIACNNLSHSAMQFARQRLIELGE